MNLKSKRSKACDIPQSVKWEVWERDGHRCIFCGSPNASPNAHIVPRSQGGLGVKENIVTACMTCHQRMDNSQAREMFIAKAIKYIKQFVPDWTREMVTYNKWAFLKKEN